MTAMSATAARPPASPASGVYETARAYRDAGLSVIPLLTDGSKAPGCREVTPYRTRLATDAELRQWFGGPRPAGIAGLCGAASGNRVVMDFDADAAETWKNFRLVAAAEGLLDLVDSLPQVKTPRPGLHLVMRCAEPVKSGVKLAMRDGKTLIETRAEGQYTVLPGSPAAVHETGKPYTVRRGDPAHPPVLTAEQFGALMAAARMLNEAAPVVRPDRPARQEKPQAASDGLKPGEDYSSRCTLAEALQLLEGAGVTHVGNHGGRARLRRPGKDRGHSGDLMETAAGVVFTHFSTSWAPFNETADFDPETGCASFPMFCVYARLKHGGDYSAAARDLAAKGYGSRPTRPVANPGTDNHVDKSFHNVPAGNVSEANNVPAGNVSPPTEEPERPWVGFAVDRLAEFVDVNANGITFPRKLAQEDYEELGRRLVRARGATVYWFNFALADWYLAMPSDYRYRKEWCDAFLGEGMSAQVRKLAVVGRAWPQGKRNPRLCWSFYRVTAAKDVTDEERAEYMRRCLAHEATPTQIEDELKQRRAGREEAESFDLTPEEAPARPSPAADEWDEFAGIGGELRHLVAVLVKQRGEEFACDLLRAHVLCPPMQTGEQNATAADSLSRYGCIDSEPDDPFCDERPDAAASAPPADLPHAVVTAPAVPAVSDAWQPAPTACDGAAPETPPEPAAAPAPEAPPSPAEPCPMCHGWNLWRRASDPPGLAWRCALCHPDSVGWPDALTWPPAFAVVHAPPVEVAARNAPAVAAAGPAA